MKKCSECQVEKGLGEFVKDKRKVDGTRSYCLICQQVKHKKWRSKNKNRIKSYSEKFCESHPDYRAQYHAQWYNANKDHKLSKNKEWKQKYPAKVKAIGAKRRALMRNAVPKWLSEDQLREIERIYENCPVGFQVDHIIPICGKNVVGLHVPWNLQYLTPTENRSKSNKVR